MKLTKFLLAAALLALFAAACGGKPILTEIPVAGTEIPTSAPTLTPTTVPPKVMNVCIAREPKGLYRYDGSNELAKQNLFDMIYPDLLSVDEQTQQALFFENIPSLENGGIELLDVGLKVGMPVQDAAGQVVYLSEGTWIEHALNYSVANPVEWTHETDYHMNQFRVSFRLRPELKWSDGAPLSAADFVFSYHLAEKASSGQLKWALERTQSLEAADDQTVVWTGVPGFFPKNLDSILWKPLPAHALGSISPEDLPTADLSSRIPLSWGPYRVTDWQAGRQLSLEKNSNFIQAGAFESFDLVNFVVEPDLQAAIEKMRSGNCDLMNPDYHLEALEKNELETLAADLKLMGQAWQPLQQLVFGIVPAVYDQGGYNPWTAARQNILGNVETRKALEACLDPAGLVAGYLSGRLPESVERLVGNQIPSGLDGSGALEAIGWTYPAEGGTTTRTASGVPDVLDGTEMRLSLLVGQSQMDLEIAELIRAALSACGVTVETRSLPAEELYKPGPEGLLFGRDFELALLSWQNTEQNFCRFYTSDQIPNNANSWVGTNLAGYANEAFDRDCRAATAWFANLEPSEEDLMRRDLPAIALMPHYQLWAAGSGVVLPDGAEFGDLWRFMPGE